MPVSAWAIQQPGHLRGRAELELAQPSAGDRTIAATTWVAPRTGARARAFARLQAELGHDVQARFDLDSGVLDTLIPNGFEVPGASRDPAVAERFTLDFLARHLELLAPGSDLADFQLVSDVDTHGVRSVGLIQTHAGLEVIGGQLSLRFKNDRLVAVRSQAFPHVRVPTSASSSTAPLDPELASAHAAAWIARDFAGGRPQAVTPVSAVSPAAILPISDAGGTRFREVVGVELALVDAPGHWQVWLDARTGEPVARRSLLRWAGLEYTVWQRSPIGPRVPAPAAYVEATVDGVAQVTSPTGDIALPVSGATVGFGTDGVYARVYNDSGPVVSVATPMVTGQIFNWDLGDAPEEDAQLNAYVHAQTVKDYVRGVDPTLAFLDLETRVTVNIDDVCNAYADGNTINFYLTGGGCENSALVADVVYHEYGHVTHTQGLIPGVGLFNGAHSEGASDYLSATMIEDPSVGRGFFLGTDAPIREIDPAGFEWRWPDDIGEVHDEGRIIGGTLWDLREALIAKHGYAQGVTMTDEIWLDGLRRAVDIPSTYLEALITNDDDGNLQNGTPDVCEINQVFAAHGLYQPPGLAPAVEQVALPNGERAVTVTHALPFGGCPDLIDPVAVIRYRPRDQPDAVVELVMDQVDPGNHQAVIPAQAEHTVTEFQVVLDWGNGSAASLPDNFGDPWYEYFNGEATEIFCTEFAGPESVAGWGLSGAWSWGLPEGGGGDPSETLDGDGVVGTALGFPGLYAPNSSSRLTSPAIDVGGFEVVRLQTQRWLTVEDGFWDHATISANGEVAWSNYASTEEWNASTHHRDREWRFHDVELTPFVGADGLVTLEFGLESDGGLEFGGWNLERLCVVGHGAVATSPTCGDGVVQAPEQCDDGNLDNDDGCSSGCLIELPPDPIEPEVEDGWEPDGRGCGCATGDEPAGGLGGLGLLGLLGLLGMVPPRRRRR